MIHHFIYFKRQNVQPTGLNNEICKRQPTKKPLHLRYIVRKKVIVRKGVPPSALI